MNNIKQFIINNKNIAIFIFDSILFIFIGFILSIFLQIFMLSINFNHSYLSKATNEGNYYFYYFGIYYYYYININK